MGTYHKQLSQPDVLLRQADRLVERRFRPGFDGMTAEELFRQSDFAKDKTVENRRVSNFNHRLTKVFPLL